MHEEIACIYGPPPVSLDENERLIVIFDLGGVLVDLNVKRCIHEFVKLMGEENIDRVLGLHPQTDDLVNLSIANRQLMREYEQGTITTVEFLGKVREFCKPHTTDEQIKNAWLSMIDKLPADRLAYIARLRRSGIRTALLSNTNELHFEYLKKKYNLNAYFDRMFTSNELHLSKPDPEIFLQVESLLPTLGANVFFIDDMQANREAAERTCGWQCFETIEQMPDLF